MTTAFRLPDSLSLDDLHTFLGRAAAVDDGSTRLIGSTTGGGGVLAAYVGVLSPAGILDTIPTVIGLRTFALAPMVAAGGAPGGAAEAPFDVVVPLRAVIERTTKLQNAVTDPTAPVTVPLPPVVTAASWAAITPPRGGWAARPALEARVLEAVAKAGIDEVAAVIPTGTGEQIVHRVRSGVWTRPLEGALDVPAGAAFAALTLGFLKADEPVRVFAVGSWTRLSTSRGHVLVKRRGLL
jgi:hypothetical protein